MRRFICQPKILNAQAILGILNFNARAALQQVYVVKKWGTMDPNDLAS